MEFKMIIYPEREPCKIIDLPINWGEMKPDIAFYLEDKKYKVIDVKHTAHNVEYNKQGIRTWPMHDADKIVNPLTEYQFPEIIVTEISKL